MPSIKKLLQAAAGNAGDQPDPDFNQVALLLNGDGTDGGQNNTYTDSSSSGHTMTPAGTIEQGSVSPFGDNWAVYVSGVDTQGFTTSTSSWGDFGTGDFSIEAWVYPEAFHSTGGFRVFDTRASAAVAPWMFGVRNSSNPFIDFMYGSDARITGSISISLNEWTHIAVTRQSGTVRLFVNGVLDTSATITSSINCGTSTPKILKLIDSGASPKGYASNIRVVKGTAVYTSAFTPPTEPLTAITGTSLLACQSNYFVDNSTNDFTLTVSGTPKVTSFNPFTNSAPITLAANGGSVFVNGAGDRLTTTESLGSGDFTVEFWAYTLNAGDDAYFDTRAANENPTGLTFTALNSTTVRLYDNAVRVTATGVSYLNQWVHFAIERSSGTLTIYVNGIAGSSAANTTNYSDTAFSIGDSPHYGDTDAYISNFRLVKGSAVYGGNFTPPTAPLTAITNTELLLNFADAAIFDYAAISNLGTTGNADISTAVVKYGTGSLAFDGTGDWLQIDESSIFAFGTGDFTIEMWVYNTTNSPTYAVLWDTRDSEPDDSSHIVLNLGKPSWWYNGSTRIQPATAPTINTWYHLAVARSGTSTKMFIDGTQVGSTYSDSNDYKANDYARIGSASDNPSGLNYFNGYIDDLRITNGLARYTSAFTPPPAALPTF
jgi:hypothetical protein